MGLRFMTRKTQKANLCFQCRSELKEYCCRSTELMFSIGSVKASVTWLFIPQSLLSPVQCYCILISGSSWWCYLANGSDSAVFIIYFWFVAY